MTTRERTVVARLIRERDEAQARARRYYEIAKENAAKAKSARDVAAKKRRVYRCVYCGQHAPSGWLTCWRHLDLLELDPVYTYGRKASTRAAA